MHGSRFGRIGLTLIVSAIPLLQASKCSNSSTGPSGSSNYTLNWVFVNTSTFPADANLEFVGRDTRTSASIRRTVTGINGAASGQTVGPFSSREVAVRVDVTDRGTEFITVIVVPDEATTITAVWNGRSLSVSASAGSATTWVLSAVTGSASGTWQDIFGTAEGNLFLSVPTTVQEGATVPVSATFEGAVTDTQWDPANPLSVGRRTSFSVGIVDRGVPGLVVEDGGLTERAQPTAFASVTVTGAWIIPSNPTTLAIEAGGGFAMAGTAPHLVVTYRKVQ